jgi:hypothetical protein
VKVRFAKQKDTPVNGKGTPMKRENKTSNSLGRQAVVVGGGMAGLMTARVLSEHFDRVVVLERNHNDLANGFSGARSGVPQGRHIHLFLVRGMRILNDLFPGLSDELVGGGASLVDLASDMLWYKNHKAKPRTPSGLHTVIATRPLVEEHARGRVAEMPNVEMKFGCKVLGLKHEAGAVIGVRYESESDSNRELCADLAVVTAGQLSLAEGWLTELGYGQAPRSEVVSDLSYTSTFVSLPKEPDWKFAVCECEPLR